MNNQPNANSPFAPDGVISHLLDRADDQEAAVLQTLLVKCGYLWRCPECQATFDPEITACEFCGTTQPALAAYERHYRVEYDLDFWGGNYNGTGTFSHVPFALIERKELSPEAAFEAHTGIDPAHIIHYSLDESFDAHGNYYDEDVAETIQDMRDIFARSTIMTITERLAHLCATNESQKIRGHAHWKTAEAVLLQALARIKELEIKGLEKEGQFRLPGQLQPHPTSEQTGDALAALLEDHSLVEAVAAITHQARHHAAQDGEQYASLWHEVITLIIEPVVDTLNNLPATPMHNY